MINEPELPAEPEPLPDNTEVLSEMGDLASAELAKEQAQVPPEAPPIDFPQIDPPPQQDMLKEMGDVSKAEAGLDKPPMPTPVQENAANRRDERRMRMEGNPFPFQVMQDMTRSSRESTGKPESVAGMPVGDVERLSMPGGEGSEDLTTRYTDHIDASKRFQSALIRCLSEMTQTIVEHERTLHEIRGFLERGRE